MPEIGQTISHYRITEKLGQGGMGEVFLAHDTSLNRKVALKFLPDIFSGDPERLARFEREAKLLASLNHPNIAAIHGLEQVEGKRFLVLELVEGETLAHHIAKGALPVDEALDVCRQIAEGLEAAHEKGIIHRDLKPANVKLTPEGKIKVLDFGLARAFHEEAATADASHSPTLTDQMTRPGVILGTAAYMSPEQAKGKPVDKRADIWAFGCVLYECLTGRRAFQGDTITETLAAIIKGEPDWKLLPHDTPAQLRDVLHRCLQKDPKLRYHDIPDARLQVDETLTKGQPEARQTVSGDFPASWRRVSWREALAWMLLAAAAISGGLMAWTGVFRPSIRPPDTVHAVLPIDSVQIDPHFWRTRMTLSPDGRCVVFRQCSLLCKRSLENDSALPIEGTENAVMPTFSPNGTELAFMDGIHIKRVAISGGPVRDVVTAQVGAGLAWGEDNRIYFSNAGARGIWSVSAEGGDAGPVTQVDEEAGETLHTWPQLLPGGKSLIFTAIGLSGGSEDSRVVVQLLRSKERNILMNKAIFGRYLLSGHLIYANNAGTIFALPFDLRQMRPSGATAAILRDVSISVFGGAAFLAASENGTLIYLKKSVRPGFIFRIVDSHGHDVKDRSEFDSATMAKLGLGTGGIHVSPKGLFAFDGRAPGANDVWILNQNLGEPERITFDPAEDEYPIWSPDGQNVAYTSAQAGSKHSISIKSIKSGEQPKSVRSWPRHIHLSSWSSDGLWFAATDYGESGSTDIWVIPIDGKDPIAIANSPASESDPQFSPNGKWIAYASDESGRSEIWVVSFPGLNAKHQVSTDGGTAPIWDYQGRVLYYLQSGYLVAHEVNTAGDFSKGRSRKLFATAAMAFQVKPGDRFVLQEINMQPPDSPIQLIYNWFPELTAKFNKK
jgi:serine/threonine-protein kinase